MYIVKRIREIHEHDEKWQESADRLERKVYHNIGGCRGADLETFINSSACQEGVINILSELETYIQSVNFLVPIEELERIAPTRPDPQKGILNAEGFTWEADLDVEHLSRMLPILVEFINHPRKIDFHTLPPYEERYWEIPEGEA